MKVTVVIADDSKMMLDRLQQLFNGMEQVEVVGSFCNGVDALTAIQELEPDIAVLDNKMPGLMGMDVIREVRKSDNNMVLMLLTYYSDSYYKKMAMSVGADYFFSKSEDFEKISKVIDDLINIEFAH